MDRGHLGNRAEKGSEGHCEAGGWLREGVTAVTHLTLSLYISGCCNCHHEDRSLLGKPKDDRTLPLMKDEEIP